jgi:alpha-galactosidase
MDMLAIVLLSFQPLLSTGLSNGLGRTPPMGWRSWNCYHHEVTQEKMTIAANAMVDKSRGISLLEAGYENCGLDDYYQACGTGAGGLFHNASG